MNILRPLEVITTTKARISIDSLSPCIKYIFSNPPVNFDEMYTIQAYQIIPATGIRIQPT